MRALQLAVRPSAAPTRRAPLTYNPYPWLGPACCTVCSRRGDRSEPFRSAQRALSEPLHADGHTSGLGCSGRLIVFCAANEMVLVHWYGVFGICVRCCSAEMWWFF